MTKNGRNPMKRLASLCLGGSMLILLAVPASAEKLKAEVIHWWTSGGESAAVKVFADAFNAAGGEWIDTAIAIGENARAAAINRVIGGNPPTAMQFNTGKQFDDIVAQGLVNDVDEVAKEGHWRDFLPPAFLDAITRNGKIYAIPVNVHGQNWMWTSTSAFEKAGATPPKNWDEFFPAMDKLKAAGLIPIALGGQPWQERIMFNQLLLGKAGKEVFLKVYQDKDIATVKSPAFRDIVDTYGKMRDYVDPGAPGRNWNDATAMLISGKAGVQFMGDWVKGEFIHAGMTAGKEYNCIVGPGNSYYMIGGDVFVLAKTDDPEQKAAQVLLAKTMLSPEVQVAFNLKKGSIPVRQDVDTSKLDMCAQTGLKAMKDPANQVGVVDLIATPDLVGATTDVITEFWNTPTMTSDQMIDKFVEALQAAG
jgi:glucose/mannose transport system substrate-binding protein